MLIRLVKAGRTKQQVAIGCTQWVWNQETQKDWLWKGTEKANRKENENEQKKTTGEV